MLTVLPHGTFATRTPGPTINDRGTIKPGAIVTGTVKGTLSVASPNDIALLEEGKRTQQAYKLITETSLQTAQPGGIVPAWIQVLSQWFEVAAALPWQNNVISHYEYIVVKIENPQVYE
jgi:hypothetical protein